MTVNVDAKSWVVGTDITVSGGRGYSDPDNVPGGGGVLQFAPTFLIDAESATLGATYTGSASDQWTGDAGGTLAQIDNVLYGSKAWRMRCPPNAGGFGQWGGIKALPVARGKGQSIHVQVSVYFPSASFDFAEANPHLKFLRLRTETSGGSNVGYQDIYIETTGRVKHIFEGVGTWTYSTQYIAYDTWETFEFRVDVDDVALASGGTGRVRVWRKVAGVMTLILDIQNQKTIVSSTDLLTDFYMFTYWNGEPTRPTVEQICYADRVVIETDMTKLVETDSNGYKIIGGV